MTKKELLQLFDLKIGLDYYMAQHPKKKAIPITLSRKTAELLSKGLHSISVEGLIFMRYIETEDGKEHEIKTQIEK